MLLYDKELPNNLTFAAGQNIYLEGHECPNAYIVTKGRVELSFKHGGGKQIVRVISKGDLFGELDWMNNRCHLFTAKAVEDTVCLKVPFENFVNHYVNTPKPMQGVIRNTLNVLRSLKGDESIISIDDVMEITKFYKGL
jgi:CRP-like cAMP-binding protein